MTSTSPTLFNRRQVLAGLAAAGVVTIVGTSPVAGAMQALALPGEGDDRVLVNVFLRGGADGLNIVVPYGDDDYYRIRGSIAQSAESLTDLDGFFGLHGAFGPLAALYEQGEMAFVQATGSNDPSRSHFSSQDNMDGAFGQGGWMQRALASQLLSDPLSGLSIGDRTSPSLFGPYSGIAFDRIDNFRATTAELSDLRPTLEAMYGASNDALVRDATLTAFTSIDRLAGVDTSTGVDYPNNSFARDLREAAALIKADLGVRMVSVNVGGWDHHTNEVDRMNTKGSQLSAALAAFKADLGADSPRVLTVVMSEFGRTARQNGSGGTDHGHGNIMMLMGGDLARTGGGRVHLRDGRWVGLSSDALHLDRDLAITTDFRSVLAESLDGHVGAADHAQVFPGFSPNYLGFLVADDPGPGGDPGTISGTVAYRSGDPAVGVAVDLFTDSGGGVRGQWLGDTRTDAGGNYQLTAPAGSYVLTFIAPTGESFVGSGDYYQPSVALSAGQGVSGVDAQLLGGGADEATIGGVVNDGAAVAGVTVDLFTANGDGTRGMWLGDARTDAAGQYSFGVQPGCFVLTFIAPEGRLFSNGGQYYQPGLCVDAGQVVTNVNAELIA